MKNFEMFPRKHENTRKNHGNTTGFHPETTQIWMRFKVQGQRSAFSLTCFFDEVFLLTAESRALTASIWKHGFRMDTN